MPEEPIPEREREELLSSGELSFDSELMSKLNIIQINASEQLTKL